MNFIDAVIDYIEQNVDLGSPITMPQLKDGNSVAVRLTPSSPDKYIAGFIYNVSFQVLTKNSDQVKAITILEDISTLLQDKDIEIIGEGFDLISIDCTTLPNWVETTDKDFHIYTALFNAQIEVI